MPPRRAASLCSDRLPERCVQFGQAPGLEAFWCQAQISSDGLRSSKAQGIFDHADVGQRNNDADLRCAHESVCDWICVSTTVTSAVEDRYLLLQRGKCDQHRLNDCKQNWIILNSRPGELNVRR